MENLVCTILIVALMQHPMVLVSALAECFLRKLAKQGFVAYTDGAEFIETSEEDPKLKPMDEKTKERVEKLKDLVMLRFGGTGVNDVIRKAVQRLGLIPVYIVSNITNFTCGGCVVLFSRVFSILHTRLVTEYSATARSFGKEQRFAKWRRPSVGSSNGHWLTRK